MQQITKKKELIREKVFTDHWVSLEDIETEATFGLVDKAFQSSLKLFTRDQ